MVRGIGCARVCTPQRPNCPYRYECDLGLGACRRLLRKCHSDKSCRGGRRCHPTHRRCYPPCHGRGQCENGMGCDRKLHLCAPPAPTCSTDQDCLKGQRCGLTHPDLMPIPYRSCLYTGSGTAKCPAETHCDRGHGVCRPEQKRCKRSEDCGPGEGCHPPTGRCYERCEPNGRSMNGGRCHRKSQTCVLPRGQQQRPDQGRRHGR